MYFFSGILKVNDESSRIRIQDPDPEPDPLVRGMDPRIRIHPKMLVPEMLVITVGVNSVGVQNRY
jgi:hypothetical protein